jgi:two-component system phosphate regulon sensor histidine kinase PhoR
MHDGLVLKTGFSFPPDAIGILRRIRCRMADPPLAEPTDPETIEGSSRRTAFRAAAAAIAVMLALAWLRGQIDGWWLLGSIAAVAAGVLARKRTDPGARQAASPSPMPRRIGTAEALLSHVPDPVILVDRRTLVAEMNEAARTLLPGLRIEHPLSFALRSPDVLTGIDQVFATGEPLRVEYRERIPTDRVFEVMIGPLRTDGAGLQDQSGVVLFFRDLTSARRLESMRVDFVANASHELRTPLASLVGFIDTLQGPARNDPAARERFLEIMRGQAQRMTRLIDDLLSLSRIEMHAHVPPVGIVDLVPLVAQIVDALSRLAGDRGVEIVIDAADPSLKVRGDRDELLRVAENLVENAVKYGENGKKVEVGLRRSGETGAARSVAISVRDYGPGIASEHLPRLTERFYRVDAADSREKGGTGLGLAIVKHIVNRHRGTLQIASELGQGATFIVTLPEACDSPSGP